MALYQSGIQEIRTKLEILQRDARFGEGHNPIDSIKSRIKSPMSIIEKMYRKGFPISLDSMRANLNDVAGIRVICPFIEDIYTVAQMLTRQDDLVVIKEKDYIKTPSPTATAATIWCCRFRSFSPTEKRWCGWKCSCEPSRWTSGPAWSIKSTTKPAARCRTAWLTN